MDITIEIMLPVRNASDVTIPGNPTYPLLGIVAVYDQLKVTNTVGMPVTGYVHVTGVPDAGFDKLKALLERVGVSSKRAWAGVASRVPAGARNNLLTNRQITVTWTAFKGFLRNLDELRDFADADIEAAAVKG